MGIGAAIGTAIFGGIIKTLSDSNSEDTYIDNIEEFSSSSNEAEKRDMEHKEWARQLADINAGLIEENNELVYIRTYRNDSAAKLEKAREKGDPELISQWEEAYEEWENKLTACNESLERMRQRREEHYANEPKQV